MQLINNKKFLSPTDLNKYLTCKHYINLEKKRLNNNEKKLTLENSLYKILAEKGLEHEIKYLKSLKRNYKNVKEIAA